MSFSIDAGFIAEANEKAAPALVEDYDHLGRVLARRGLEAEAIAKKVAAFGVALPTWGVGTGGTRFARFPGPGEPRHVFEKIEDCGVIHQLTRATPQLADRIIFVTGGAFSPAARDFLERVGLKRMDKPVDLPNLRVLIRSLLGAATDPSRDSPGG